jgi:iron(III) transport system substrate-binding protein
MVVFSQDFFVSMSMNHLRLEKGSFVTLRMTWIVIRIPRWREKNPSFFPILLTILFGIFVSTASAKDVIVYCALDQPYAEPVIAAFEKKTGINVKPIYDSEAVKTTGLVNRIIAESKHPQCDVFWNNEKLRTVMLSDKGLLESYESPLIKQRELPHDSKNRHWTEFAGRCRVIVYNPAFADQIRGQKSAHPLQTPLDRSVFNLELQLHDERDWLLHTPNTLKGKIAIAYPLFGTTSTHFLDWLHLERRQPESNVETLLQKIFSNQPIICNGNSDVVKKVATGEAYLGFTDSDDVFTAQKRGLAVDFFYPQAVWNKSNTGSDIEIIGTLLIPNTVALIRSAPHKTEAQQFIDFILSEETELILAKGVSQQIPLGKMTTPLKMERPEKVRSANEEILIKTLNEDIELLRKTFRR